MANLAAPDLAQADPHGQVSIIQNLSTTGTLSFGPAVNFAAGMAPATSMAIADMDGNGLQDILVTNSKDSTITLLMQVYGAGIREVTGTDMPQLYPYPNSGSFTLHTSGDCGSDYIIRDMQGRIILQRTIKSDTDLIDMRGLAEGIYTLVIKGARSVRFVVLHE